MVAWDGMPAQRAQSSTKGLVAVVVGTLLLLAVAGFGGAAHPSPPGGSYAFMDHQPGQPAVPVTWSACRPIHVVVNDPLAPPEGWGILMDALDQVHAASGLDFVVDGRTTAVPTDTVSSPHGIDWDPVLIAWMSPARSARLRGDVDGYGGSTTTSDPASGRKYYVTGQIALDAPQLTRQLHGPDGAAGVRGVIVHELGHVIGLAHVADGDETMARSARRDGRLGPGDRAGFALLGTGPCYG